MPSFNSDEAMALLREFSIPRLACSYGERKVKEMIVSKLRNIENIEVRVESFLFGDFLLNWAPHILSAAVSMILIAYFLVFHFVSHFIGLILSFIPFIIAFLFDFISKKYSYHFITVGRKCETDNIYAKINASGEKHGDIIFMAHYDSKSQTLSIKVRILLYSLGVLAGILSIVMGIIITIISDILKILLPQWNPLALAQFSLILTAVISLLTTLVNRTHNRSPGTLDNATGIVILLALCKELAQNPLRHYDVHFVFTGAEEFGMIGALMFKKAHKFDKNKTFVINFDGVGRKNQMLCINTAIGLLRRSTGRQLNRLIFASGEELGVKIREFNIIIGAGMDHFAFALEGFEATAFLSKVPEAHTPKDSLEIVDINMVRDAFLLALNVVRKIDKRT